MVAPLRLTIQRVRFEAVDEKQRYSRENLGDLHDRFSGHAKDVGRAGETHTG